MLFYFFFITNCLLVSFRPPVVFKVGSGISFCQGVFFYLIVSLDSPTCGYESVQKMEKLDIQIKYKCKWSEKVIW